MADVSRDLPAPPSPMPGGPDADSGALPRPLTSFVGRQRELAEARRLLDDSYLVTLTGPGGSGKTRLCIALAAAAAGNYPDGLYFVPLAPVLDPGLVPSSIAQAVGLQDSVDRPLVEHLASHLREREALIILDNFEHLLDGASAVAELLRRTRALRILVTSRAPLRISGEQEYPVPPLAVPDLHGRASPASLAGCESVRLFTERAAAAVPGFAISNHNAGAVAHIVRRLDGLPLAIELAAARVKLLPPEAILPRLERSLSLLVGGRRDLPDRQQTLGATIAWSFDLLSEGAGSLLAICSVFAGGADLETIEAVCAAAGGIGLPVLDGLQELVDQSLLRQVQSSAAPRFAMLETIREFAAERLAALPDAAAIRTAHAAAFLALARQARAPLATPELLERLDSEYNNIRAAIDWYRIEDPAAGLRLAGSMSGFWSMRGHFTEGRQRLRELLALVPGLDGARVRALNGAGWLAVDQGDYPDAEANLGESIELSRTLADKVGEGMATLGLARSMLHSARADEAATYLERAGALLTDSRDPSGTTLLLLVAGLLAQYTNRLEAACDLFGRCAAMCSDLGFQSLGARSLQMLGIARLSLGDPAAARAALAEGLPVSLAAGDRWAIPLGLAGFAGVAARSGQARLALRLAGAAEAYRETYEIAAPQWIEASLDRWLAPCRAAVGRAAERVAAEGRQMQLEEAVTAALASWPDGAWRADPARSLTRREAEVAALAAAGLTNRDIAARLVLSVRTVEVHLDHILSKLGFRSRTQLAAWAFTEGGLPDQTGPTG